jgi:GNAT superfamily N-acetyltransferase
VEEFRVQVLTRDHDRERFTCGVTFLDTYLKTQATQDMRRKANAVFVMIRPDAPARIVGYFTLCAFAVEHGEVPDAARKHLPRYPLVSATLIGRLAIDSSEQGAGIGRKLLAVALWKAYENSDVVGSSMVVVDAIDERAAKFYTAHGFIRLPQSMRLVMPMRAIAGIVKPDSPNPPQA